MTQTNIIMLALAGYYLVYAGGPLRWRPAERALTPK